VSFQREQSEDTKKLQRTLVVVRKRYDDLKRNVIASRVRKVLLRVSFGSWKTQAIVPEVQVPESKLQEVQEELSNTKRELTRLRIHKILGSFERRLVSSRTTKLRTYLHRWRYGSIEEKTMSRAFRVLTDATYRRLREAIKTWKTRTAQITLLIKVTKRIANSTIASAWNTWRRHILEERQRQREIEMSRASEGRNALAAELARTRRHLAMHSKMSILTRLTTMKLRVPFETWKDKTLLVDQRREEMGMALSRLLRLCDRSKSNILREYFWSWVDRCTHLKHAEAEASLVSRLTSSSQTCALLGMQCAMAKISVLQKALGFRRWREFVWSERLGMTDERIKRHRVRKFVRRWLERQISAAFFTWRERVEEGRHHEDTMKRFVKRVLNSALSQAFRKWIVSTLDSKTNERAGSKLYRCLVRIAQREKFAAFATWAASVRFFFFFL
jgi:hypothetical protein